MAGKATRNNPVPRDELIEAYLTGTPLDALRRKYKVCIRRLWRILERRGVKRRNCRESRLEQSRQVRAMPPPTHIKGIAVKDIIEQYLQGNSTCSLSKKYKISMSTINRNLRLNDVPVRSIGDAKRAANALLPKELIYQRAAYLRSFKKKQPAPPDAPPAPVDG